jgi:hypothetical protein
MGETIAPARQLRKFGSRSDGLHAYRRRLRLAGVDRPASRTAIMLQGVVGGYTHASTCDPAYQSAWVTFALQGYKQGYKARRRQNVYKEIMGL